LENPLVKAKGFFFVCPQTGKPQKKIHTLFFHPQRAWQTDCYAHDAAAERTTASLTQSASLPSLIH
jgi:hypothetical protein